MEDKNIRKMGGITILVLAALVLMSMNPGAFSGKEKRAFYLS